MSERVRHHIPFGFPLGIHHWKLAFVLRVRGHGFHVYRPAAWPRLPDAREGKHE